MRLVIRVDRGFQGRIDKRWLRRLVRGALAAHGAGAGADLGLLITDDDECRCYKNFHVTHFAPSAKTNDRVLNPISFRSASQKDFACSQRCQDPDFGR